MNAGKRRRKMKSGNTKSDYQLTSYDQQPLEFRLQLGKKYWKNTKKFDVGKNPLYYA